MGKIIPTIAIAFIVLMSLISPVWAQMATINEARTVASNWILLIIQLEGDWGGYNTAKIEDIQEFKRGERVIGYFCRVNPTGFIVVSLRKELAPIKAYSVSTILNPKSEEALADLIKYKMEGVLDAIEEQLEPPKSLKLAQTQEIENILEINYRQSWEELERDAAIFKKESQSKALKGNYQRGQILLTSAWHQRWPYNHQCPNLGCSDPKLNGHARVGCVATAGAQTMRYWNWPPYRGNPNDIYDWTNMPDTLTTSSPQIQIDAVAELCYEVGVEAGMDYGCDGSGACFASCWGSDLLDTFEDHFRYSDAADDKDRDDYSAVGWFNRIKGQLNLNRPLPYRIPNHVIVADGWQEIGSMPLRQYHINYGWYSAGTCQNGCNIWYTLDAIYKGNPDEEMILVNIQPAPSLGSSLSGTYSRKSFPYRYFDQDATGVSATFESGQYLQFLQGVTVKGSSRISIEGSSSLNTRLFTRGDPSKGIRIYDGTIKLRNNGGIHFY